MTNEFELPPRTKREELISYISDTYKDLNGIRPRWAWDRLTDQELEESANEFSEQIRREHEAKVQEEADHAAAVAMAMTPKPLANQILCDIL